MNKKQLLEKCESLGIQDTEGLTNSQLEELIKAKEAELEEQEAKAQQEAAEKAQAEQEAKAQQEAAEKAQAEQEAKAQKEAAEKEPAVYVDDRSRRWVFKKEAPKRIRIEGRLMTQEEIFATEDVISELVYGNSNFLKILI